MDVLDPLAEPFPLMPCVVRDEHHRPKIGNYRFYNALVSRPVSRAEMLSDPEAMQSMLNEWGGLWAQDTFDGSWIREYDEVVATSKAEKQEVHLARVHGICVEKNYQLPKNDKKRKFKGRGVLLGDQVKIPNLMMNHGRARFPNGRFHHKESNVTKNLLKSFLILFEA